MNLYFYPKTAKVAKQSGNPYTRNFMEALKDFFTILNANDPSSTGILNSAKYLPRIDFLLLNWIEDIPDKKGGFFQSLYFIFLVHFLKAAGKKIVWVMHNKLSHYPHNLRIKKFLFNFLTARADLIITHAREGVVYAKSASGKKNLNIRFFPHPTMPAKP